MFNLCGYLARILKQEQHLIRSDIARAICKDPAILVLDEATSALDGETESSIYSHLRAKLSDKTLIIIAHRLSTLRDVNRIVVMEDGRIVEEGSPGELLAKVESRFFKMWQKEQRE